MWAPPHEMIKTVIKMLFHNEGENEIFHGFTTQDTATTTANIYKIPIE